MLCSAGPMPAIVSVSFVSKTHLLTYQGKVKYICHMKKIAPIVRPPDRIGWERPSAAYPAKMQRNALTTAGIKNVYSTVEGDTLDNLLNWTRPDSEVWVYGPHRLATNLADFRRALDHFREQRVRLYDMEKGVLVNVGEWSSLADAVAVITGEIRSAAKKRSLKHGSNPGGRPRKPGAASEAEALRMWKDLTIPTNHDVAELTGWSLRDLRRKFKGSGRPVGFPKGRKK